MIVFIMWVRWTLPRFRYDQLMDLAWKPMIPLALINLWPRRRSSSSSAACCAGADSISIRPTTDPNRSDAPCVPTTRA